MYTSPYSSITLKNFFENSKMNSILTEAIFERELNNRFLCECKIGDVLEVVYVPSSCRLSNFCDFSGKTVLLRRNKGKNCKTRYALYAILHNDTTSLVYLSDANEIVCNEIIERSFVHVDNGCSIIEKEVVVDDYKCDLYIPSTRTIIEIKTVLSFEKSILFPNIDSTRAKRQLRQLNHLLDKQYNVIYILIALNDITRIIEIDSQREYSTLLKKNLEKGMHLYAFCIDIEEPMNVKIKSEIDVVL